MLDVYFIIYSHFQDKNTSSEKQDPLADRRFYHANGVPTL